MLSRIGAWRDAVSSTMELKCTVAVSVLFLVCFCPIFSQELNPKGRNVCKVQGSPGFMCCSGWVQQGEECFTPLCEGNFTCNENEVCVRPNECRCRHGYFGASCDTKCPAQFWGPDCKGMCTCHPNGKCDDVTGKCTCYTNRWGENCEKPCHCQKGKCDQEMGKCTCHANYWGPQCNNNCYCSINSVCDQSTGRCICNPGWFGRNCRAQCLCNNSPCEQFSGRCQCREMLWGQQCEGYCQCVHGKCNPADGSCTCKPGYRGKLCREPCPAGFYGQNCRNRCGHCKGQQPCKVTEGRCVTCESGWNGTKCDQMCTPGYFGENCMNQCPPCKDGHHCSRIDGKCSHCNPGWIGDRCEVRCPNGTYGDNCENDCSHCFNGDCHFATGECLCDPGFYGTYCNLTCEFGQFGVNCAQTCPCHDKNCNPVSGACNLYPNQRMGVIAAGTLVTFLLVVLLSLLCCCFLCSNKNNCNPDQENSTNSKKAKIILCGGFSRISTKLPRIPLRRQKLPKVVVTHHDPENTVESPSVVDQPSPSWSSQESFSSFETSEDGPVYCIPHEETMNESYEKQSSSAAPETSSTPNEDAGEYTSLKNTRETTTQTVSDGSEQPLLKSSDSEGSSSGSESTMGAVYAHIARLSKLSKEEEDNASTPDVKGNGKAPSTEKMKPRPPDPSTKPKVSWIHGTSGTNQTEQGQTPTPQKEKNSENSGKINDKQRSKEKSSKNREKHQDGKKLDETESPSKTITLKASDTIDHLNGTFQNAWKKIGSFHSDKKISDTNKDPPKSPKIMHPHMNSEAATLLAAQLKEKTQSLNRNEGLIVGIKHNGVSTPQASREKPTPPQKTKRSITGTNKPLLPTSSNLQKMVAPISDSTPESKSLEKQGVNVTKLEVEGEATPKKTPIKKPPRKKGKEGILDSVGKSTPKTAIMPPQTVK
ncbi:scavenger receptor class F member 2-like [Xyrauchen texanus]|uniref:scavenger receptor class F member 2-like n=1 Tax=Xyrauchen texanus TaxID=154827 RepID=UPI0022420B02|nr:scavenger receptor class F member 2-like [Xyrauchen texanus]